MFRQNSARQQLQGFSVHQPTLGAQLIFLPAVGSKELEQLIDAYLPGPASAREKRAAVSMDFFEHSRLTGDKFKFYPVDLAAASPESISSAAWDSSYSTGFEMSPGLSDVTSSWSFASLPRQQAPAPVTPASQTQKSRRQQKASAPARPSIDLSGLSGLPGMKILTKDGRDVTNSASRGCKTKEQRDHAHLMRIIKACDSCRRKKIRCDPSHKKRAAASQPPSEAKPVKKAKKAVSQPLPRTHTPTITTVPSQLDSATSDSPVAFIPSHVDVAATAAVAPPPAPDDWEQFIQLDQDFTQPLSEVDTFLDSSESLSPVDLTSSNTSSSNTSSYSPAQPITPANAGLSPIGMVSDARSQEQQPSTGLPHLDAFGNGAHYVDFNLFSPQSNFLDEEPTSLKPAKVSVSPWSGDLNLSSEENLTRPVLVGAEHVPDVSASYGPLVFLNGHDVTGLEVSGVIQQSPAITDGIEDLDWPVLDANTIGTHHTSTAIEPGVLSLPTSQHRLLSRASPLFSGADTGLPADALAQTTLNVKGNPLLSLERRSGQDSLQRHGQSQPSDFHTAISATAFQNTTPTVVNGQASSVLSGDLSTFSVSRPDIRPPGVLAASSTGRPVVARERPSSGTGDEGDGEQVSVPATVSSRASRLGFPSGLESPFEQSVTAADAASLLPPGRQVVETERLVNAPEPSMPTAPERSVISTDVLGLHVPQNSGFGSFVFGSLSSVDGAVAATGSALVWLAVGSVLLLTLQAGSAKMPEGLFGLVFGGGISMAQAFWSHTPPRSSKPTLEDLSSSSALSEDVAGPDGGRLHSKINVAWRKLRCSMGKSIGRLDRSIVSGGVGASCWRT